MSSLAEVAYQDVRDLMMSGKLSPVRRLVESRLAEQLQISRTPLRQALVRLESDGLIHRESDGYYPTIPALGDMDHLYEVRLTLERQAMRRVIESGTELRHDPAVIEALRDDWEALKKEPPAPSPDIVLMDEEFHERLAEASGNPVLAELLRGINARIRLVRMYDYITEDRVHATITEHLEILDKIASGELEGALAGIEHNIRSGFAVVRRRAQEALSFVIPVR